MKSAMNVTADGCYITSMLGYVAFKAPGSKVVAGVADDRDCGSRCVADLTCTFFSWDATASQCLLFTSANTLTYFMDKQDNSVVGFIESCNTNEGPAILVEILPDMFINYHKGIENTVQLLLDLPLF